MPTAPLILVHVASVALLMVIFPFSKLLHAPGVFFSPTRNQTDSSRLEGQGLSDGESVSAEPVAQGGTLREGVR